MITSNVSQELLDAIARAYEDARGAWVGCDWGTDHGTLRLDLDGADASEMRKRADRFESHQETESDWFGIAPRDDDEESPEYSTLREYRQTIVDDLTSAAEWLDECAAAAASAETEGAVAMECVGRGNSTRRSNTLKARARGKTPTATIRCGEICAGRSNEALNDSRLRLRCAQSTGPADPGRSRPRRRAWKMKMQRETKSYNERRCGKPWIAVVDFSGGSKGEYRWGEWCGQPGTAGLLILNCEPGQIVALGQKDNRKPANSAPDFYIAETDGSLRRLATKADAYRVWQAAQAAPKPAEASGQSVRDAALATIRSLMAEHSIVAAELEVAE